MTSIIRKEHRKEETPWPNTCHSGEINHKRAAQKFFKQWRGVGGAFCLQRAFRGIVHPLVLAVAEDPGSRPSAAAVPASCIPAVYQADETCVLAVH